MLNVYNKGFTVQKVLEVTELYAKYKLPYSAGFLIGGPGENHNSVSETVRMAKKLKDVRAVYFTVGLTMGGGNSRMEKEYGDKALLRASDLIDIKYYLDEGFDKECAELLLNACRENPGFFISDSFLSENFNWIWKFGDFLNLRPIWKSAGLLSRMLLLLNRGNYPLKWDDVSRRFIPR